MAKSSGDVLGLIETALDEFDTVPLAVSVRRAIRIANLIGDSKTAIRLSFEVKPSGGHPPANASDTRRFLLDERDWGNPAGIAEQALQEYCGDRRVPNEPEKVLSHSLDEIDFWTKAYGGEISSVLPEDLPRRALWDGVVQRTRSRTFAALCGWERQLSFTARNDAILSGYQTRVDALLVATAPQVIDQFNAVFRRLNEAAEAERDGSASEELPQAVTSCRRVLKAVVDIIQPADPRRPRSEGGHALNDDAYRNRLFEFLKQYVESETFLGALTTAAESLFERFGATDKLASKGVHSAVARDEAEFCASNTYLLAGELLRMHASVQADGRISHERPERKHV